MLSKVLTIPASFFMEVKETEVLTLTAMTLTASTGQHGIININCLSLLRFCGICCSSNLFNRVLATFVELPTVHLSNWYVYF